MLPEPFTNSACILDLKFGDKADSSSVKLFLIKVLFKIKLLLGNEESSISK